jgi:hypothetical protein
MRTENIVTTPQVSNKSLLEFIQVLPKKKVSFGCGEPQNPSRGGGRILDVHPVPSLFPEWLLFLRKLAEMKKGESSTVSE